jgi:hypothetical protein
MVISISVCVKALYSYSSLYLWERVRVRVKPELIPLPLTPSRQGREENSIS